MKASVTPLATSQRQFILNAIKSGQRLDSRNLYDYRPIKLQFGVEYGTAEVKLGASRVLAVTTCELIRPITRPEEGRLLFNVELSPMASPLNHSNDVIDRRIALERRLEQCFVESAAIDLESLCVIAGEKVWFIRVAIHVLDDVGNILDCASIAAIASLAHFRRPQVTVVGEDVTIHNRNEKDYIPLNIHHMPLCITFAFFHGNGCMAIDPTDQEEAVMESKLVMALNRHREICTIQFTGGVTLKVDQVLHCCNIALTKANEIIKLVQRMLNDPNLNIDKMDIEDDHVVNTENQESRIELSESIISDNSKFSNDQKQIPVESMTEKEDTIIVKDNYTAEIGLGGSSTWEVADQDDSNNKVIPIAYQQIAQRDQDLFTKQQQTLDKKSNKISNTSDEEMSESDEDEVITLQGNDVMMESIDNDVKSSKRGKKNKFQR